MAKRQSKQATPATPAAPVANDAALAQLTALAAALGMSLAPTAPAAAPVAPAAKGKATPAPVAPVVERATRCEQFAEHISPEQAKKLDGIYSATAAVTRANKDAETAADARRTSLQATADALIAGIWPKNAPCPKEVWEALRRDATKYDADGRLIPLVDGKRAPSAASTYPGKVVAEAYKRLHGALPNADATGESATRGDSPKKVLRGIESRVAEITESVARLMKCKANVNAAKLEQFRVAFETFTTATAALRAAVNE